MLGPIDYRNYDPERFAEDHPDDPMLQRAREGANQLARDTPPQQEGESPGDAANRFDQGFNEYERRFDERLDDFHQGERHNLKQDFYQQQRDEINQKWDAAQQNESADAQWGSQKARNNELDALDKSSSNNFADKPEYLAKREQLENLQGVRSEAISHEIGKVEDAAREVREVKDETPPPSGNTPPTDELTPSETEPQEATEPLTPTDAEPPTPADAEPPTPIDSEPLTPADTEPATPADTEPPAPTDENQELSQNAPLEESEMEGSAAQNPEMVPEPTESANVEELTPAPVSENQDAPMPESPVESQETVQQNSAPVPTPEAEPMDAQPIDSNSPSIENQEQEAAPTSAAPESVPASETPEVASQEQPANEPDPTESMDDDHLRSAYERASTAPSESQSPDRGPTEEYEMEQY